MYHTSTQKLGNNSVALVPGDVIVVNMVAQHGYRPTYEDDKKLYLHYPSLSKCLEAIYASAERAVNAPDGYDVTIHMPRIGCGFVGGSWEVVEQFVSHYSDMYSRDTYVYDLE